MPCRLGLLPIGVSEQRCSDALRCNVHLLRQHSCIGSRYYLMMIPDDVA